MLRKFRKFLRLPGDEKIWFLKAIILLPLTYLGVRVFGLKRYQAMLARTATKNKDLAETDIESVTNKIARVVMLAAYNGLIRANCLQRSLSLWWLLRREGIESELHLGVQKENEQVKGHAWIERHGKVLNDDSDVAERFVRFGNPQDFHNS